MYIIDNLIQIIQYNFYYALLYIIYPQFIK